MSPNIELSLRLLGDMVATHRVGVSILSRAALTFAVTREGDGQLEIWTLHLEPKGVQVERGAPPIEYSDPFVTLYLSEQAIQAIATGSTTSGLEAEGDSELLEALADCLRGPSPPHRSRVRS